MSGSVRLHSDQAARLSLAQLASELLADGFLAAMLGIAFGVRDLGKDRLNGLSINRPNNWTIREGLFILAGGNQRIGQSLLEDGERRRPDRHCLDRLTFGNGDH